MKSNTALQIQRNLPQRCIPFLNPNRKKQEVCFCLSMLLKVTKSMSAGTDYLCLIDTEKEEELFSIMQTICKLVDSIPEHELIGLSCGTELLLNRALRYVHLKMRERLYNGAEVI